MTSQPMMRCAAVLIFLFVGMTSLAHATPDRFWLGMLWEGGEVTPFALYDKGKWSMPWPEEGKGPWGKWSKLPPFTVKERCWELDAKTVPLADVPAKWLGSDSKVPTTWHLWSGAEDMSPMRVTNAIQYTFHCTNKWGLLTDYQDAKRPLPDVCAGGKGLKPIGFVSSTKLTVTPMVPVPKASQEAQRAMPFIATAFQTLEATWIENSRRRGHVSGDYLIWGHPLSAAERDQVEFEVQQFVGAERPIRGRMLYYTEIQKWYGKPPDRCRGTTQFRAWMAKEEGRFSIIKTDGTMDDTCDGKSESSESPDFVLSIKDDHYVVSRSYGYESESYTVSRITESGIQFVISGGYGGC